jgi:hypothetical protein
LYFIIDVNAAYVYLLYVHSTTTPFFRAFGRLLFGKPPVSPLANALSQFSQCSSLSQLCTAFGSFIPKHLLQPAHSGNHSRRRIFSLEAIFWSFFDQVQTPHGSCREAVRKVIAFVARKLPKKDSPAMSPNTAAYCAARSKIPLDVLEKINAHLADRLQGHIPVNELWHGRNIKLVDGTGLSMPDTEPNQARWPQRKNQRRGCGFPAMNLVGIFCLLSGALIQAAHGNGQKHETKLFRSLWEALNPGDVLVADRGFCSFAAIAGLLSRGVDCLMRLPEKRIHKAIGSQLPKRETFDVIITWKRPAQRPPGVTKEDFEQLPESLPVRVVCYNVSQKGFRSQNLTIVTTLLDAAIGESDLADLFFRRWRVETHFHELKIHLHMDVLRCRSPHMIERELFMHFIAYNLIRCVMQKAALIHHSEPGRISFKGTLDSVRHFASACAGAENKPLIISTLVDEMLNAIARDLVPIRPDRSEPRVRKRRPKNYRLMTRPRHEMGPLPHRKIGVEFTPKSALS